MRYVTYDESGNLTGCFNQDLHPDHAAAFIEVADDVAAAWVNYRAVEEEIQIGEDENGPIMSTVWMVDVKPPVPYDLAGTKVALVRKVDDDADAIYSAVMGARTTEYTMAEADALAFAAGGYEGDAPASVQCWADVKGQTAQWAADDILATATAWRTAQAAIRANRLSAKEQARTAADEAALATAAAGWAGFVTVIRSQLGLA